MSGAWPGVPIGPEASDPRSLDAALFARRVVLLAGELDPSRASDVGAALMTLDATGDAPVELRLSGTSGGLDAALMLVDVIEVLGVPVHTVGLGVVSGGPVGVLATGAHRLLSAHGRLQLAEPPSELGGRASDLERALAAQAARRDEFLAHLAARIGRPLAELADLWARGTILGAEDAVGLGFVDAVQRAGR